MLVQTFWLVGCFRILKSSWGWGHCSRCLAYLGASGSIAEFWATRGKSQLTGPWAMLETSVGQSWPTGCSLDAAALEHPSLSPLDLNDLSFLCKEEEWFFMQVSASRFATLWLFSKAEQHKEVGLGSLGKQTPLSLLLPHGPISRVAAALHVLRKSRCLILNVGWASQALLLQPRTRSKTNMSFVSCLFTWCNYIKYLLAVCTLWGNGWTIVWGALAPATGRDG